MIEDCCNWEEKLTFSEKIKNFFDWLTTYKSNKCKTLAKAQGVNTKHLRRSSLQLRGDSIMYLDMVNRKRYILKDDVFCEYTGTKRQGSTETGTDGDLIRISFQCDIHSDPRDCPCDLHQKLVLGSSVIRELYNKPTLISKQETAALRNSVKDSSAAVWLANWLDDQVLNKYNACWIYAVG